MALAPRTVQNIPDCLRREQRFDPPSVQLPDRFASAAILGFLIVREELGGNLPDVLARMINVNDLNGTGEMLVGNVPDPERAVRQHHFDCCLAPASLPGFGIDAWTKLFRRLDGPHISGGIFVADGPPLVITLGLREHAGQFDFPSARTLTLILSNATFGLRLHYRDTGAVHLDVKFGRPRGENLGSSS